MKTFYHSRYRFYKPHQKEHKILAISDIHFSDRTTENLDQLAQKIEHTKPQIITISGDLIDSLESADEAHELARLQAWLERLGRVAPVCLCLGNHDFYRKPEDFRSGLSKKRHYIAETNAELFDKIKTFENIHLLDNETFENPDFYVVGITLPPEYYQFDYITQRHGSILNPGDEDVNILLDILTKNSKKLSKLPKHKTKILLIHSPFHILDEPIAEKLQEFDFIFAGHMHNGVVPPLLNEVWRGHRGIITPSKHLFRNQNTRSGLYKNQLIVLGAVTTIQKGAKPLSFLNGAFPVNYATVETSHNEVYARKPDRRNKYEKWSKNAR